MNADPRQGTDQWHTEVHESDVMNFILGSAGKQKLLSDFGQDKFEQLLPYIHQAYVSGIESGLVFASALALVGAVLAILFVRSDKSHSS